jgi:hypothetical protein
LEKVLLRKLFGADQADDFSEKSVSSQKGRQFALKKQISYHFQSRLLGSKNPE